MDVLALVNQFVGAGQQSSVNAAAADHINSLPDSEVSQHLQQASQNANASGQADVGREIQDLLTRAQSNPSSLKDGAISYITSNPQVLAQFAPAFAQGILSRI